MRAASALPARPQRRRAATQDEDKVTEAMEEMRWSERSRAGTGLQGWGEGPAAPCTQRVFFIFWHLEQKLPRVKVMVVRPSSSY